MRDDPVGEAVAWIRDGGLVAFPTETVWGLAADARSDAALARLRRWKQRGDDAPIAVLVADADALDALGLLPGSAGRRLARAFWPGPLTLVVRGGGGFAAGIARSDGAVGVRCSSHPLAGALARRCAAARVGPVTATSLNKTGTPAAATRSQAAALCGVGDDVPRLLAPPAAEAGGEAVSTVVDVSGTMPEVLRWGALGETELAPVLEEIAAA